MMVSGLRAEQNLNPKKSVSTQPIISTLIRRMHIYVDPDFGDAGLEQVCIYQNR